MSLLSTLNIGQGGLAASQTGVNTSSHNISNADTQGYNRQRVTTTANQPFDNIPGTVGTGVNVHQITRVHDEFTYTRLKSSSANLEYNDFTKTTLQEITNYLPDLEGQGVAKDLKEFYNAWSSVSLNPNDKAQKVVLTQSMQNLTSSLNEVDNSLVQVSDRLNETLKVNVDEVNSIAKDIAEINKKIGMLESGSIQTNANDLRDQRDTLELRLSKLVDTTVFKGNIKSDNSVDMQYTDQGKSYNINIAGHNIVDGISYHPITVAQTNKNSDFNSVYFKNQNGDKLDITDKLRGGKIGALVDLRGTHIDSVTNEPANSKIQEYRQSLDSFTKSLVQSVNSIYAKSPQKELTTDSFEGMNDNSRLINYDNIKEGSFKVNIYDNKANIVASRVINIDENTTLKTGENSIVEQFNKNIDDNGDNDATNDLDDLFKAELNGNSLHFFAKDPNSSYTISLEDNGSNFAGVSGVHKLFVGDSAKNIDITKEIKEDPSSIQDYITPIAGDGGIAQEMVELQYKNVEFTTANGEKSSQTIESFYRSITTQVASDAKSATANYDSAKVLNTTVQGQMDAVSAVNMDEELVNLMKFQNAYSANAKVISTIDRMMDTLLGIKQ